MDGTLHLPNWYLAHAYLIFGSCLFGIWLMPIWYLAHAYLSAQVKEFHENQHEPNMIGFFQNCAQVKTAPLKSAGAKDWVYLLEWQPYFDNLPKLVGCFKDNQNYKPACHGTGAGASRPPTIRLATPEFFIQYGILAHFCCPKI